MAGMTQTLPAANTGATEQADMALLMTRAYELGESLIRSDFAAEYVQWKTAVRQDAEAQGLQKRFMQAKEKFAECERFGRFHPDYNAALEQVYEAQQQLDEVESVRKYKAAENTLDELLIDISRTLAFAVSQSIKVPDNNPNPRASGCGNGGSCSCGSGGCG